MFSETAAVIRLNLRLFLSESST